MKLPGFGAENSLGSAMGRYRSAVRGLSGPPVAEIVTSQLTGGTAIWAWPWWQRCPPGCFPTGRLWPTCFCWSPWSIVAGPVHVGPGVPIEGGLIE
jgi:hypothetical protein